MKSDRRFALTCMALAVTWSATPSLAARRTPHQELDAILAPWMEMLSQVRPTEPELQAIAELRARAEDLAQRVLEEKRHGGTQHLASLERQLAWTVRLARARVEAARADAALRASEQARDVMHARSNDLLAQLRRRLSDPVRRP